MSNICICICICTSDASLFSLFDRNNFIILTQLVEFAFSIAGSKVLNREVHTKDQLSNIQSNVLHTHGFFPKYMKDQL